MFFKVGGPGCGHDRARSGPAGRATCALHTGPPLIWRADPSRCPGVRAAPRPENVKPMLPLECRSLFAGTGDAFLHQYYHSASSWLPFAPQGCPANPRGLPRDTQVSARGLRNASQDPQWSPKIWPVSPKYPPKASSEPLKRFPRPQRYPPSDFGAILATFCSPEALLFES